MPLAKRSKSNFDNIKVIINRAANTVRWLVNDVEKFKISDLGMPIDRSLRFNNHGGPPVKVDLKQINVGFGNFSLMDFSNPVSDVSLDLAMVAAGNITPNMPLVQLDNNNQYFDPQRVERATGNPLGVGQLPYLGGIPYDFIVKIDGESQPNNRNFGQGAVMKIRYIKAYYSISSKVVPQFPAVIR